ncbi:hypothetical protein [Novipirellula sp.]|uniref:hypothetical protein n=1 Tax=Novipirellula sp. TaxID=2795430 RepID=UPI00356936F2
MRWPCDLDAQNSTHWVGSAHNDESLWDGGFDAWDGEFVPATRDTRVAPSSKSRIAAVFAKMATLMAE